MCFKNYLKKQCARACLESIFEITRKYLQRGYIQGMLTHTTSLYRFWENNETLIETSNVLGSTHFPVTSQVAQVQLLTHTTAWDRLWRGNEALNCIKYVIIYNCILELQLFHSSQMKLKLAGFFFSKIHQMALGVV